MEGDRAMTVKRIGPAAQPTLADLILKVKNDISYSLNCTQVGTIESYNPATNTASISINFKRQLPNGDVIDYPLLGDCPVFILGGGGASIDMPIGPGDECLVLFADRCIDDWHISGKVKTPANPRAHNIADGFALVGVHNLTKAAPTSTCLRVNGRAKKIAIKNNAASLKPILDSLIDAINLITVTVPGGTSSVPLNTAAFTAIKAQIALLLDEGLT